MPVTALTAVNLQHWLIRRWGKRSPATWNARLAASRVLIGYCQRQGWIERDPTTSLERPSPGKGPPEEGAGLAAERTR